MDFSTPKNISDVRSWFGLINQVAFAFSKGAIMAPFRELLKAGVKFEWTDALNRAFEDMNVSFVILVTEGLLGLYVVINGNYLYWFTKLSIAP